MMDFLLRNNDLEISNGDINLCHTNVGAIAQSITIRLKTLAGEWFLNENVGLPYLRHILGRKRNDRFLTRILAKEIEGIPGVKELSDFSFDESTTPRSITIKFKVTLTDQSTITINESIGI